MGENETMSAQDGKKRLHPLYIWALIYVVMTYLYPILWYKSQPMSGGADSKSYEAASAASGTDISMFFLAVPIVLFLGSLIFSFVKKNEDRMVFLNAVKIIKFALIPFFIMGGVLIVLLFLLIFTPVVIMIFVMPVVIGIICVLGWLTLLGTMPLMFTYLSKSVKEGKVKKGFAIVIGIMQAFFGLDVLGTIISSIREKL